MQTIDELRSIVCTKILSQLRLGQQSFHNVLTGIRNSAITGTEGEDIIAITLARDQAAAVEIQTKYLVDVKGLTEPTSVLVIAWNTFVESLYTNTDSHTPKSLHPDDIKVLRSEFSLCTPANVLHLLYLRTCNSTTPLQLQSVAIALGHPIRVYSNSVGECGDVVPYTFQPSPHGNIRFVQLFFLYIWLIILNPSISQLNSFRPTVFKE